ncbi:hypothetical protein [Aquimarina sediminis]|uniref:hypothetical protein n=1 Tax=Aquimarina sediminis TaxID=2070536 RepID=UPI000CA02C48|nr:hypothetical protein [Aquimarina sediminis]
MAFASSGILLFAIGINFLRELLLGINEGYAPHNFGFNFMFFLPAMITAFILALAVVGRTVKYWKTWTDLKKKWTLIGLSLPALGFWTFIVVRMIVIIPE